MTSTIAIDDLCVGMYIQLEGGWLSHPFPLSSFRIAAAEQIATLRGLGLARVRWSPEKSQLSQPLPAAALVDAAPLASNPPLGPLTPPTSGADALPHPVDGESHWLADQRAAARHCERQYGEAAECWRQAWDSVATQPQQAARTTQALTQAMLDKMLAADDVGIRLVAGGGDRAAAHALNVTVVSVLIGRTLRLGRDELVELGVGALLHDVGKQEVAERHRQVGDSFVASDLAAYRDHVARGLLLGRRMGLSPTALTVLAQHHEHADGSGFPLRVTSERMTLAARIVAIVNRYDNLCNPGGSTPAMTPHEAVAMLFAQGHARYDTTVLNTFIRMMGVYPAGSLVQLTDDRYAMVVGVNSSRPLKPRVLVHGSGQPPRLVDLEGMPDLGIRRSLAAARLPAAVLQSLDPRPRVSYYFEPIARERQDEAMAA